MWGSYGPFLQILEMQLNRPEGVRAIAEWLYDSRKMAMPQAEAAAQPLAQYACPVYGVGYNWLQSNADSGVSGPASYISAQVIGANQAEVTAVLADSPGALQLLPNAVYTNHRGEKGWLKVRLAKDLAGGPGEETIVTLPEKDPYAEIYAERRAWWRLMDEALIDPARTRPKGQVWLSYLKLLAKAVDFHAQLGDYYHPNTFAFWGAGDGHQAWDEIVWSVDARGSTGGAYQRKLIEEPDEALADGRGSIAFALKGEARPVSPGYRRAGQPLEPVATQRAQARIAAAAHPGDEIVPASSGAAPHTRGKLDASRVRIWQNIEHQSAFQKHEVREWTFHTVFRMLEHASAERKA